MKREGGCFCGAVRYEVVGEPLMVEHCHCLHCRRIHGAPFVTWAEFSADGFRYLRGAPSTFESRPKTTRSFCDRCGSPLNYRHEDSSGSIDVIVATLDDPESLTPREHIWHDRKLSWIELADDLPRHAEKRTT